jgi:hypothetical protein
MVADLSKLIKFPPSQFRNVQTIPHMAVMSIHIFMLIQPSELQQLAVHVFKGEPDFVFKKFRIEVTIELTSSGPSGREPGHRDQAKRTRRTIGGPPMSRTLRRFSGSCPTRLNRGRYNFLKGTADHVMEQARPFVLGA